MFNIALAQTAKCIINGAPVDCSQLGDGAKALIGVGIGFFVVMAIISIVATIFWIWMLVHAIKNEIDSKALWIILIIFTGLLGAIIYYFAVKRPFDKKAAMPAAPVPPVTQAPSGNSGGEAV